MNHPPTKLEQPMPELALGPRSTDLRRETVSFRDAGALSDDDRRIACVLAELPASRGLRILDVGHPSGRLACLLASHGRVTAASLAPSAPARELQVRHPEIDWMSGDLLHLDLPEGGFDVVSCLETLPHAADPLGFAARLAALTSRGGTLVVTSPNERAFRRRFRHPPGNSGLPSRRDLVELFDPWFDLRSIRTCCAGSAGPGAAWRGIPAISALAGAVLGADAWVSLRERAGFGCSLVLVGVRRRLLSEGAPALTRGAGGC
jgi:SAM-dependent methyltransferase